MCDQDHKHTHSHGQFEVGRFSRFKPIGRRTFLASLGKSTFALLTEASLARNVITIALGTTGLVACAAPARPATSQPAQPTAAPATATSAPTLVPTAAPTAAATATTAQAAAPAADGSISYNRVNFGDTVNGYVLVRGTEVAVVDTGFAFMQSTIEEVLKTVGRSWGDVKHVILTHYHDDHSGGMDGVMKASINAAAYAGTLDIPRIHVDAKLKAVEDGAEVFGLQIVATPGHTAGHISIFDPIGSVLIAGDALNNLEGKLSGPNPKYSDDMATGILSANKLAKLTFERAFFGHGIPIDAGASAALTKLVATLK